MSITKEDKFKAYYFGQMTVEDLADFQRKMGENEDLRQAYGEYKTLQDAFLAEEYVRNYANTSLLSAADHEELYFFVEGDITDEDRIAAIKARLKTDDAYREEYEMMKEVAIMDVEEVSSSNISSPTLTSVQLDSRPETGPAKVRRPRPAIYRQLGIAASVLVMLAVGWWAISRGDSREEIAGLMQEEGASSLVESSRDLVDMGTLGSAEEDFNTLRQEALKAVQAGNNEAGQQLLLRARNEFRESWTSKVYLQGILIKLLMLEAGSTEEKRMLALDLTEELVEEVRANPESYLDELTRLELFYAPQAYNRALLLSLSKDGRSEARKLLDEMLENSNLPLEYKRKMQELRNLI